MQIELTKEQYYNLVKLVSMGGWVLESILNEVDEDGIFEEEIQPMLELEQYILSKHNDFGFDKVFKDNNDRYVPNYELEDEIMLLLRLFEENSFWEQLIYRLARRDIIEEFGESAIDAMDPLQINEIEDSFITKYQEEFSENGIDRLVIQFSQQ